MSAEVNETIIDTETPDGEMAIAIAEPDDDGVHPTIIVFHDGPGMRKSNHDFNRQLAAEGYRIVMPDLYHRHGRMIGFMPDEANDETRAQTTKMLRSLTDDGIQSDLDAALAAVGVADDEKMGTIGFCLGACAIYRTLMRLPESFVVGASWHPSFLADDGDDSPHLTAAGLTQPVYFGIGTADQVQSIAMHQRFFDAVAPLANVEVEIFDGADHGYTWPETPNYHKVAATTSWAKTTKLFAEHLQG